MYVHITVLSSFYTQELWKFWYRHSVTQSAYRTECMSYYNSQLLQLKSLILFEQRNFKYAWKDQKSNFQNQLVHGELVDIHSLLNIMATPWKRVSYKLLHERGSHCTYSQSNDPPPPFGHTPSLIQGYPPTVTTPLHTAKPLDKRGIQIEAAGLLSFGHGSERPPPQPSLSPPPRTWASATHKGGGSSGSTLCEQTLDLDPESEEDIYCIIYHCKEGGGGHFTLGRSEEG